MRMKVQKTDVDSSDIEQKHAVQSLKNGFEASERVKFGNRLGESMLTKLGKCF